MKESNIHKSLSSEARREIILFLGIKKRYLTEIAEHIQKTPQTVDFHLNVLQDNGIVKSVYIDGKKFYELTERDILKFVENRKLLPPGHHPKPPHEIVLDIKKELNERMGRIEKKLDRILSMVEK